ncbi:MAG TPA: hypothetical protein VM778_10435 [Gemmatimonadota bacterium]|nr:hypothetical protein [Gemmatimonadota bacterium]
MKCRSHLLGIALAATLALPGSSTAQDGEVGPREVVVPLQAEPAAVPGALSEIYRRFAAYWEDGNARAIARLTREARVHVVVQRRGVGARLSSSQLQYLLEEIFDETEEVALRFPGYAAYDPSTGAGYAVGERVYRDGAGHDTHVDRIFVGARSERGHFVVSEIRLTSE